MLMSMFPCLLVCLLACLPVWHGLVFGLVLVWFGMVWLLLLCLAWPGLE
jgi:hypothetical protein